jgi:CRISPR-associated protein Csm2
VAKRTAEKIAGDKYRNKPSQIRQFYDELVMWEEKVRQSPARFGEYLPFIRMLNAKAAYAEGRKHVDQNFVELIAHCLGQVSDERTLRNFKLFFEAFLGFYKLERPSG